MYTKNLIPLVGLAALGWLGFSASGAVAQGLPSGGASDSTPRSIPAPTPTPRPSVLLLTDGQVQSVVIEDDRDPDSYLIKVKANTYRLARSRVEYVASSLEDLYRYRTTRFPAGDADEHIKLARWCLAQNLRLQAREQLQAVLSIAPNDPQALRMVKSMDAADEAAASRVRDDGVRQAGAEMAEETNPVNEARVNKALRGYGNTGLPVVFDLPPTVAVRRAKEFANGSHLVLQRHCASCHNERYEGNFRLVQMKTRKDFADETIIRANLDATLQIVNPDNPGQSPLLTRAIVPHGNNPRPVLTGPNDRAYQTLAAWANSLRGASRSNIAAPAAGPNFAADPALTRTSATIPEKPTFAIDRNGKMVPVQPQPPAGFGADRQGATPDPMAANGFNMQKAEVINYQDGKYQGQGGGFPTATNGGQFQLPPGFQPQTAGNGKGIAPLDPSTVPIAPGTPARLQSMTGQASAPAPAPPAELPTLPGAAPAAADPATLPAVAAPGTAPSTGEETPLPAGGYNANNLPPKADIEALSKSSRKRKKLSPAQLEAIMKARNGNIAPK